MQFEVTILGCSGAIPAYNRHPSSHFINYNGHGFLIDCGEATQMQMAKFNIRRAKLDHIFISHLHGDHFFGLMGLISALNLNYRENQLNIYGPEGLEEIVNTHFKYSKTKLSYPIKFFTTQDLKQETILDLPFLTVDSFPLSHRIPTTGFLFREKKGLRKIIPEKIQQYNIPVTEIAAIKLGKDYNDRNGTIILNKELTKAPTDPKSYAYCSDTVYDEKLIGIVKDTDVLYHETTFKNEHALRAKETFHATTVEAASIAKKAAVKRMIIGHFSARYEDLSDLLREAKEVFPETFIAEEGKTFAI